MLKKAILLACSAVFFLASNCLAQEWAKKMFDTTEHKFGTVARGAKVEHRFTITNLYEEDAHIASVRSSCGCTSPQVTKDSLKTFEKSELVAVFNTRSFQGEKSATITVQFDKPFFAEVQVQVSGYIRTDVVLEPGLVDFGSVPQGNTAEKHIAVTYAGRGDWKITDVKTASDHLSAQLTETGRNANQVTYDLIVKLEDKAPAGYIKEQLFLVTNDARAKQMPVDVEGHVTPSISVSPVSLHMGVLQPGQKVTKQLVVKGKQDFLIVDLQCDDDCFKFDKPVGAKSLHIIPVTFKAGDKLGKVSQKVHIDTDLTETGKLECVVYALVVEPR